MTKTPIIKTIIAAFAIFISNLSKIIEISILPIVMSIPLILAFSEILPTINTLADIQTLNLGLDFLLYTTLFIYAFLSLQINLYRLTSIGQNAVFKFGLVPISLVLKLIPFYFFVEILVLGVALLQIPFLEPVVFILLAHILLKFVAIATGKITTSSINIIDRLNIAIVQFIIPMLFLTLFSLFGIGILVVIAKIFTIYFSAISLGLIFNNLNK
jgi:hypothetical protein